MMNGMQVSNVVTQGYSAVDLLLAFQDSESKAVTVMSTSDR